MDKKISNSFLERLKGLGVKIGTELVSSPKEIKIKFSIKDVISGYEKTTQFGTAFIAEKIYPKGSFHGKVNLLETNDLDLIFKWAKASSISSPNIENLLFLDTETSSLVGGAGTFAFMIGLGYFTNDSFKVVQIFLEDPNQEPAFLYALDEFAAGFDTLVTFNGKSFDIPVLKTRYYLYQYPNPFEIYNHIDLLHLARRIWKNRLTSCRLGDLENEILNFKRAEDEIPGWLVPQIYHDYLFSRDARPLAGVFYHNQNDIISMAALMNELSLMLVNPYNISNQSDLISIGKLFEDLSLNSTAQQIYNYCTRLNLTNDREIELLLRAAKLHSRMDRWDEAIEYWSKAADIGSVKACIEISKVYEHQKKDLVTALISAQRGMNYMAQLPQKTSGINNIYELENRISRIQGKINSKKKDIQSGKI
jgi:uncharacterized protein